MGKPLLFQLGGALLVVAAFLPYFLDEDVEQWLLDAMRGGAGAVGLLVILLGFLAPSAKPTVARDPDAAPVDVVGLAEGGRLLRLAKRQADLWSGVGTGEAGSSSCDTDSSSGNAESATRMRKAKGQVAV